MTDFFHTRTGRILFCALLALLWVVCAGFSLLSGLEPLRRELDFRILLQLRLPRVFLGSLAGSGFAVSGMILQGVLRNPLASPELLGVSAGGGLVGILVLLFLPGMPELLVPLSFAGALGAAFLVYAGAWRRGASPGRLILSGVAVSAMLGAGAGVLLFFHAEKAGGIFNFTFGSLAGSTAEQCRLAFPYAAAGLAAAWCLSKRLDVLLLGDDAAGELGLPVEGTRLMLLAVAALLAAASVAAAGLLGFTGLVVPHLIRLVIGTDHRYLLPGCVSGGALLVVLCDWAARTVAAPAELPCGIFLALAGPCFFLWLLQRKEYED